MYSTPVLGADIGGIPELIQQGKTGELFKSADAAELKNKIQTFWTDRALMREYSSQCAGISFDNIEDYTRKMITIYQER